MTTPQQQTPPTAGQALFDLYRRLDGVGSWIIITQHPRDSYVILASRAGVPDVHAHGDLVSVLDSYADGLFGPLPLTIVDERADLRSAMAALFEILPAGLGLRLFFDRRRLVLRVWAFEHELFVELSHLALAQATDPSSVLGSVLADTLFELQKILGPIDCGGPCDSIQGAIVSSSNYILNVLEIHDGTETVHLPHDYHLTAGYHTLCGLCDMSEQCQGTRAPVDCDTCLGVLKYVLELAVQRGVLRRVPSAKVLKRAVHSP